MITPSAIQAAILSSAPFPGGPTFPLFATAVGNAVAAWIPTVQLTGVTAGTLGAGTVTGKILVVPNPTTISNALSSAGSAGVTSALLSIAVSAGIATAVSVSSSYVGVSAGVSAGTDISFVTIANGPALIALLQANFAAVFGLAGGIPTPNQLLIASGLGTGIANMLIGSTTVPGTGIVVPTTPAPGVGAGTSVSFLL